jgi:hypothetical protein
MPLRNGWREGDWLYNCQRCGFTIYGSEAKREWTGLNVCSKCWEPRHPQEFVRGVRDDMTVPFANPPGTPYFLGTNEVNYTTDVEVVADDGVQSPVLSPGGATVLASS